MTEAKRQLAGRVGIDGIAGPSELLVVADGTADPRAGRARPLRPGRARRRQPAGGGLARPGAARPGRASWSRSSPPSARASPTRRWRWSPRPGSSSRSRSPTRFAPEHLELAFDGRRRGDRARPGRRLRVRRRRRRDRVRRLRRRLQPRAADRRRRALRRPARARARSCAAPRSSTSARRRRHELAPHVAAIAARRGLSGPRRVGDRRG